MTTKHSKSPMNAHEAEIGVTTEQGSFKLTAETAQLLADIGFLAIRRNRLNAAVLIFEALKRFRPNSDYPVIGLALAAMSRGANDTALEIIGNALRSRPDSGDLLAFRSLALYLSQRHVQSREIAVDLIEEQTDPQIIKLASTLRDEIDRGLSPLHPQWHKDIIM